MIRAIRAAFRPFAIGAIAGAAVAVGYYRGVQAGGVLLGAGLIVAYLVDLLLDVTRPWLILRVVFILAGVSALAALMLHFYPRSVQPPHTPRSAVHGHR